MMRLAILYVSMLLLKLIDGYAQLSETMSCADQSCSETLSEGKAKLAYQPKDKQFLNLKKGDTVLVKGKGAGLKASLWGGKVLGKKDFGFFPSAFVKEYTISHQTPTVLVNIKDFLSQCSNEEDLYNLSSSDQMTEQKKLNNKKKQFAFEPTKELEYDTTSASLSAHVVEDHASAYIDTDYVTDKEKETIIKDNPARNIDPSRSMLKDLPASKGRNSHHRKEVDITDGNEEVRMRNDKFITEQENNSPASFTDSEVLSNGDKQHAGVNKVFEFHSNKQLNPDGNELESHPKLAVEDLKSSDEISKLDKRSVSSSNKKDDIKLDLNTLGTSLKNSDNAMRHDASSESSSKVESTSKIPLIGDNKSPLEVNFEFDVAPNDQFKLPLQSKSSFDFNDDTQPETGIKPDTQTDTDLDQASSIHMSATQPTKGTQSNSVNPTKLPIQPISDYKSEFCSKFSEPSNQLKFDNATESSALFGLSGDVMPNEHKTDIKELDLHLNFKRSPGSSSLTHVNSFVDLFVNPKANISECASTNNGESSVSPARYVNARSFELERHFSEPAKKTDTFFEPSTEQGALVEPDNISISNFQENPDRERNDNQFSNNMISLESTSESCALNQSKSLSRQFQFSTKLRRQSKSTSFLVNKLKIHPKSNLNIFSKFVKQGESTTDRLSSPKHDIVDGHQLTSLSDLGTENLAIVGFKNVSQPETEPEINPQSEVNIRSSATVVEALSHRDDYLRTLNSTKLMSDAKLEPVDEAQCDARAEDLPKYNESLGSILQLELKNELQLHKKPGLNTKSDLGTKSKKVKFVSGDAFILRTEIESDIWSDVEVKATNINNSASISDQTFNGSGTKNVSDCKNKLDKKLESNSQFQSMKTPSKSFSKTLRHQQEEDEKKSIQSEDEINASKTETKLKVDDKENVVINHNSNTKLATGKYYDFLAELVMKNETDPQLSASTCESDSQLQSYKIKQSFVENNSVTEKSISQRKSHTTKDKFDSHFSSDNLSKGSSAANNLNMSSNTSAFNTYPNTTLNFEGKYDFLSDSSNFSETTPLNQHVNNSLESDSTDKFNCDAEDAGKSNFQYNTSSKNDALPQFNVKYALGVRSKPRIKSQPTVKLMSDATNMTNGILKIDSKNKSDITSESDADINLFLNCEDNIEQKPDLQNKTNFQSHSKKKDLNSDLTRKSDIEYVLDDATKMNVKLGYDISPDAYNKNYSVCTDERKVDTEGEMDDTVHSNQMTYSSATKYDPLRLRYDKSKFDTCPIAVTAFEGNSHHLLESDHVGNAQVNNTTESELTTFFNNKYEQGTRLKVQSEFESNFSSKCEHDTKIERVPYFATETISDIQPLLNVTKPRSVLRFTNKSSQEINVEEKASQNADSQAQSDNKFECNYEYGNDSYIESTTNDTIGSELNSDTKPKLSEESESRIDVETNAKFISDTKNSKLFPTTLPELSFEANFDAKNKSACENKSDMKLESISKSPLSRSDVDFFTNKSVCPHEEDTRSKSPQPQSEIQLEVSVKQNIVSKLKSRTELATDVTDNFHTEVVKDETDYQTYTAISVFDSQLQSDKLKQSGHANSSVTEKSMSQRKSFSTNKFNIPHKSYNTSTFHTCPDIANSFEEKLDFLSNVGGSSKTWLNNTLDFDLGDHFDCNPVYTSKSNIQSHDATEIVSLLQRDVKSELKVFLKSKIKLKPGDNRSSDSKNVSDSILKTEAKDKSDITLESDVEIDATLYNKSESSEKCDLIPGYNSLFRSKKKNVESSLSFQSSNQFILNSQSDAVTDPASNDDFDFTTHREHVEFPTSEKAMSTITLLDKRQKKILVDEVSSQYFSPESERKRWSGNVTKCTKQSVRPENVLNVMQSTYDFEEETHATVKNDEHSRIATENNSSNFDPECGSLLHENESHRKMNTGTALDKKTLSKFAYQSKSRLKRRLKIQLYKDLRTHFESKYFPSFDARVHANSQFNSVANSVLSEFDRENEAHAILKDKTKVEKITEMKDDEVSTSETDLHVEDILSKQNDDPFLGNENVETIDSHQYAAKFIALSNVHDKAFETNAVRVESNDTNDIMQATKETSTVPVIVDEIINIQNEDDPALKVLQSVSHVHKDNVLVKSSDQKKFSERHSGPQGIFHISTSAKDETADENINVVEKENEINTDKMRTLEKEYKSQIQEDWLIANSAYGDVLDLKNKLSLVVNELKSLKKETEESSSKLISREAKEVKQRLTDLEEFLIDRKFKESAMVADNQKEKDIQSRIRKLEADLEIRHNSDLYQAKNVVVTLKEQVDKLQGMQQIYNKQPDFDYKVLVKTLQAEVEDRKKMDEIALLATERETQIMQMKIKGLESQLHDLDTENKRFHSFKIEAESLKVRLNELENEATEQKRKEESTNVQRRIKETELQERISSLEAELQARIREEGAFQAAHEETTALKETFKNLDDAMKNIITKRDTAMHDRFTTLEKEFKEGKSSESELLTKTQEETQELQEKLARFENTLQMKTVQNLDQNTAELQTLKDQIQRLETDLKHSFISNEDLITNSLKREEELFQKIVSLEDELKTLSTKENKHTCDMQETQAIADRVQALEAQLKDEDEPETTKISKEDILLVLKEAAMRQEEDSDGTSQALWNMATLQQKCNININNKPDHGQQNNLLEEKENQISSERASQMSYSEDILLEKLSSDGNTKHDLHVEPSVFHDQEVNNHLPDQEVVSWDESFEEREEKSSWDEELGCDNGNLSTATKNVTKEQVQTNQTVPALSFHASKTESEGRQPDIPTETSSLVNKVLVTPLEEDISEPTIIIDLQSNKPIENEMKEESAFPTDHYMREVKKDRLIRRSDLSEDMNEESALVEDLTWDSEEFVHPESVILSVIFLLGQIPYDIIYALTPLGILWVSLLPEEYQEDVHGIPWSIVLLSCVLGFILILVMLWRSGVTKQIKKERELIMRSSELRGQIQELMADKLDKEKSLKDSQVKLKDFNNNFEAVQTAQAQTQEKVDQLKNELDNMHAEKEIKTQEIQELQTRLKHSEQENIELLDKSEQVQKSLDEKKNAFVKCEKALTHLQKELKESHKRNKKLEDGMKEIQKRIGKKEKLEEENVVRLKHWERQVEDMKKQIVMLEENTLKATNENVAVKLEAGVLKEALLQFRGIQEAFTEDGDIDSDDEDLVKQQKEMLNSLIDVAQVNKKMKQTEIEKGRVIFELEAEKKSRKETEARVEEFKAECENVRETQQKAERHLQVQQAKLNVMQEYYAKREVELQGKLGKEQTVREMNESMLAQEGDKTNHLLEQLEMYRKMNEDSKREFEESEKQRKAEINQYEKKAHNNWLESRESERKLDEASREITQLRLNLNVLEQRCRELEPREPFVLRPRPGGMFRGPRMGSNNGSPAPMRSCPPFRDTSPPPPGRFPDRQSPAGSIHDDPRHLGRPPSHSFLEHRSASQGRPVETLDFGDGPPSGHPSMQRGTPRREPSSLHEEPVRDGYPHIREALIPRSGAPPFRREMMPGMNEGPLLARDHLPLMNDGPPPRRDEPPPSRDGPSFNRENGPQPMTFGKRVPPYRDEPPMMYGPPFMRDDPAMGPPPIMFDAPPRGMPPRMHRPGSSQGPLTSSPYVQSPRDHADRAPPPMSLHGNLPPVPSRNEYDLHPVRGGAP